MMHEFSNKIKNLETWPDSFHQQKESTTEMSKGKSLLQGLHVTQPLQSYKGLDKSIREELLPVHRSSYILLDLFVVYSLAAAGRLYKRKL